MLTADPIKLSKKLNQSRKAVKTRDNLTSPTQKKAQQLLEREKAIEKSSRLFILLNQQYLAKYGTKNPHSDVNDAITLAIRNFLDRDGSPTTSRLKILEDQVADIGSNYRKNVAAAKAEKAAEEERVRVEHVAAVKKAERDAYVRPHLTHDETTQWSVLGAFQNISYEEKALEEKRRHEKKGADYRAALKEQIDSQEERRRIAMDERRRHADELDKLSKKLEIEEMEKKKRQEQKFHNDREVILSQIDDVKKRREMEKQESIAFQKREMARAQRLLEEEEQEREAEKMRLKRMNDLLIQENEKDKARKKEIADKMRLEDLRLQREYEEKLEREDRARASAFQSRVNALAKIGNSFATTGAGAIAEENSRKEESRMLEDIRKKQLADEERENAKQRKRRQDLLDAKAFNRILVERKEEERQKEKEEAKRMREKYLKEAEENERESAAVKNKQKQKAMQLKMSLDEQVAVHRKAGTRKSMEALTDIELKINRGTIERIEGDPDLQEKLFERIKAPPGKRDTGFKYG